jgi:hypothetical protein
MKASKFINVRYLILASLGTANLFLFQNCSNYSANVTMSQQELRANKDLQVIAENSPALVEVGATIDPADVGTMPPADSVVVTTFPTNLVDTSQPPMPLSNGSISEEPSHNDSSPSAPMTDLPPPSAVIADAASAPSPGEIAPPNSPQIQVLPPVNQVPVTSPNATSTPSTPEMAAAPESPTTVAVAATPQSNSGVHHHDDNDDDRGDNGDHHESDQHHGEHHDSVHHSEGDRNDDDHKDGDHQNVGEHHSDSDHNDHNDHHDGDHSSPPVIASNPVNNTSSTTQQTVNRKNRLCSLFAKVGQAIGINVIKLDGTAKELEIKSGNNLVISTSSAKLSLDKITVKGGNTIICGDIVAKEVDSKGRLDLIHVQVIKGAANGNVSSSVLDEDGVQSEISKKSGNRVIQFSIGEDMVIKNTQP